MVASESTVGLLCHDVQYRVASAHLVPIVCADAPRCPNGLCVIALLMMMMMRRMMRGLCVLVS